MAPAVAPTHLPPPPPSSLSSPSSPTRPPSPPSKLNTLFHPLPLLLISLLLRLLLLLYGLHQDATSPLKYTDIDYYVFTDAARFLSTGQSPYTRATYRYTPLLAYLLLPTTWFQQPSAHPWVSTLWFSWGKLVFALADVAAAAGMLVVLRRYAGLRGVLAGRYVAACWAWNPMVAAISTRGSSEGLLGALVVGMLVALLCIRGRRGVLLAGALLGAGVHLKIYPVVYGVAVGWWLGGVEGRGFAGSPAAPAGGCGWAGRARGFVTVERILFVLSAGGTFAALTGGMYAVYGAEFLHETYTYHLSRLDHRHNFSAYNTLLHLLSSSSATTSASTTHPNNLWSTLPFLPQLLLSTLLLPLPFAQRPRALPATLFAQTFAFVALNKVVTSQYFLWYLCLLPFYLPSSRFVRRPGVGVAAAAAWVGAQAAWLAGGWALEFRGVQVFFPGLWVAGVAFLGVNLWILGVVVGDLGESMEEVEGEGKEVGKGEKGE